MKVKDLKEPYYSLAMANLDEGYTEESHLVNAFTWKQTEHLKQGHKFWLDVNRGLDPLGTKEIKSPSNIEESTEGLKTNLQNTMGNKTTQEVRQELSIQEVNKLINKKCEEFKIKLLQKNIDYNNSLYKRNIFDQEPIEGLKARISDKLNRILSKGIDDKTEDSMEDLMGYYIHYKIMRKDDV